VADLRRRRLLGAAVFFRVPSMIDSFEVNLSSLMVAKD